MPSEAYVAQMSSAVSTLLPKGIPLDLNHQIKNTFVPDITDRDLKVTIGQLRARLGSDKVLSFHSDYDLSRFLRARKMDVDETVIMYEQMLAYRRNDLT